MLLRESEERYKGGCAKSSSGILKDFSAINCGRLAVDRSTRGSSRPQYRAMASKYQARRGQNKRSARSARVTRSNQVVMVPGDRRGPGDGRAVLVIRTGPLNMRWIG